MLTQLQNFPTLFLFFFLKVVVPPSDTGAGCLIITQGFLFPRNAGVESWSWMGFAWWIHDKKSLTKCSDEPPVAARWSCRFGSVGPKALLSEVSAGSPGRGLIFRVWFGFSLALLRGRPCGSNSDCWSWCWTWRVNEYLVRTSSIPMEPQRRVSAAGLMPLVLREVK